MKKWWSVTGWNESRITIQTGTLDSSGKPHVGKYDTDHYWQDVESEEQAEQLWKMYHEINVGEIPNFKA